MNVILTHDHSDLDAVASLLGAALLFPGWQPVLGRALNRNVRDFLTLHWDALPFQRDEDLPPDTTIKRALLVDTQTLPSLKGVDTQGIAEVHVIDHHEPREVPVHWRVEREEVGACTTLFVERLAEGGQTLSWVEATLLLLGLHEDTGSLVYSGTTARDGRAAAWLLEQGAHLDTLRQFLDQPLTPKQQTLYRRLLEGSETLEVQGFACVVASATMEDYVDDISSLARSLRELYDPAVLLLAVAMGDHVQLVARSTTDDIHVGHLMADFNGGGHTRAAAGFVDDVPLAAVVARLKARLAAHIRPAATVGDWMSRGRIRTLAPDMDVGEGAERMRRWGHEGFPVVDAGGAVVGVLTRRDVDRALQHGLHGAPVTEFMHKGNLTLTPDASLAQAQRVMTEATIGQVPVVAPGTGELVGIITRTDLLRRIEQEEGRVGRPDTRAQALLARLRDALSPATFALVERIAGEAAALGFQSFLVGGLVRDLLLNSPLSDLDIVVEGDALALARRLERALGGRVVTHPRFGTAKWLLEGVGLSEGEALPPHIDLITARTEFYERPTALPQVEHGSIKQDLHRRDFTINTLALALDPAHAGQLLDFYGGEADLTRGIIRVLHNLSFVEDPTRILRAIRFEQRFGFMLEPRTAELLYGSLDLLEQVSPDRLRHELVLTLREPRAEPILQRLDELGILTRLLPDVRWDASDAERFARLREVGEARPEAFVAALVWNPAAGAERIDRVAARLGLPHEWRDRLHTMYNVRAQRDALVAPDLAPSGLYQLLHPHEAPALALLATLTEDEPLRERLRFFLDDLRHHRLAVDGADLRASGLPPGPAYREILSTLHAALLDGHAPDEATQRVLLAEEVERVKRET